MQGDGVAHREEPHEGRLHRRVHGRSCPNARTGNLVRGFGGDTLNTALYLARLGVAVDYVTALGDDIWSDEMAAAWGREGIGLERVRRLQGRMPGLYIIRTDADGERSFHYWRDRAAARDLFTEPGAAETEAELERYDLVYLSGISLSLYGETGRAALFETLRAPAGPGRPGRLRHQLPPPRLARPGRGLGGLPRGPGSGRRDLRLGGGPGLALRRGGRGRGAAPPRPGRDRAQDLGRIRPRRPGAARPGRHRRAGRRAARVVDTTAAGDSFAAAYLAARIAGLAPEAAAAEAHRLAGAVIGHRGAVIPRDAMPAPAARPPGPGA